jgi:gluconolactonase
MEIVEHASGLTFPEGPVVLPDGSLVVTESPLGRVTRVAPDGTTSTLADVGLGPSGLAFGPDGFLYCANSGGSGGGHRGLNRVNMPRPSWPGFRGGLIQRIDPDSGRCATLYDSFDDGQLMQAPNDLVFDASGGMWFTDHGRDHELGRNYGGVFYARIDGSHIARMDFHFVSPNGIGLSPDELTLYVADSFLGRLWAFDIESPGVLAPSPSPTAPARVVQTLPGYQILDSLKVEAGGKICVGTIINGGVTTFDEDGSTDHVAMPDVMVTNLCFGGADMRDVYVTASTTGTILRARWPRPGLRLNFNPY